MAFSGFIGCVNTVEVLEWMSNSTPHFVIYVINYSHLDQS